MAISKLFTRVLTLSLMSGGTLSCANGAEEQTQGFATHESKLEVQEAWTAVPPGADAIPRVRVAFRSVDGARTPIEGEATAYAHFRNGVVIVDLEKRLVFITPDGARRTLAAEAGAPPERGPNGELVYVSRRGLTDSVQVLDEAGEHRVIADGFASAGVLAPQDDGRVVFVAATNGGVAGIWVSDASGVRCVTNCTLLAGAQWGDAYVPLPQDREAIRVSGDHVEWEAFDGSHEALLSGGAP